MGMQLKRCVLAFVLALGVGIFVSAQQKQIAYIDGTTAGAPGSVLLGKVVSANLNSAGSDNAVAVPFSKYIIRKVVVTNVSTSLAISVATVGVYTSSGGGGSTVVTAATLTALTGSTKFVDMTIALSADSTTASTLYVRNVLANGAPATADVYIFGDVLP